MNVFVAYGPKWTIHQNTFYTVDKNSKQSKKCVQKWLGNSGVIYPTISEKFVWMKHQSRSQQQQITKKKQQKRFHKIITTDVEREQTSSQCTLKIKQNSYERLIKCDIILDNNKKLIRFLSLTWNQNLTCNRKSNRWRRNHLLAKTKIMHYIHMKLINKSIFNREKVKRKNINITTIMELRKKRQIDNKKTILW